MHTNNYHFSIGSLRHGNFCYFTGLQAPHFRPFLDSSRCTCLGFETSFRFPFSRTCSYWFFLSIWTKPSIATSSKTYGKFDVCWSKKPHTFWSFLNDIWWCLGLETSRKIRFKINWVARNNSYFHGPATRQGHKAHRSTW